ncbi:MAG: hypothetical protein KatS3mg031_1349 [Chitinophagales bacterium]|nr:MAG: hypothetical protein KatS3mg031_1349 [Chitinophagales bacterium]
MGMILYNVTIKVDPAVEEEWLAWMKLEHIPEVMRTGLFSEYRICRLLEQDDTEGKTFAVQYLCNNLRNFDTYRATFAPALQQKHYDRFGDKCVAFRTVMEIL